MGESKQSRRTFLKGAGLMTAGAAATGLAGTAMAAEAAEWLPEAWDGEADVLVLGMGDAGLSAAITVLEEELGSVLVLEAAPEEERGGNSRVCGQLLFIPGSVEDAMKYQTALNHPYAVEEELLRAWAENLVENYDWLTDLGADLVETPTCNPEFPSLEGSETCHTYFLDGVLGKGLLWNFLFETAEWLDCEFQYNARAVELIQNPLTKEVLGVKTADGRAFKANKGVIMACGGFGASREMMNQYYTAGYPDTRQHGTPHNLGDGINMALSVGAQLWHMNNYSMSYQGVPIGVKSDSVTYPTWPSKDYIYIGPDGKRYSYEETATLCKHGKVLESGTYVQQDTPHPNYAVFGSKAFDTAFLFPKFPFGWLDMVEERIADSNEGLVEAGIIVKADTAAELAEKIGVPAAALEATIETYNGYCAAGKDLDFGRGEDVIGDFTGTSQSETAQVVNNVALPGFPLEPLTPPFYAMRQYTHIVNTQGGPKRGTKGEVLNTKGEAIPRLYAAGELGCIYSFQYNGGGNVSEAISSGRLAARSIAALEPWTQE